MAQVEIKARLRTEGIVRIAICEFTIQQIAQEIVSFVNRRGAQWTFGVHDPTPEQLVRQYINTGGLQRCVDAMNLPVASIIC